jgi:hypothetical protein
VVLPVPGLLPGFVVALVVMGISGSSAATFAAVHQ